MTFEEYQNFAKQNWRPGCDAMTFALGLGGETGEVLEVLKKARRDCAVPDIEHLKEELGDVLWYVANLCTSHGFTLEEVINLNMSKLGGRYKESEKPKYLYRRNGPHIEKVDAVTGKHVKFCSLNEIPDYVRAQLETECSKHKEVQRMQTQRIVEILGGNHGQNDCPFD